MSGGLRPGVLFDVDGTLVDTNYLHALAWSRAFRDAGEWAPMNAIHRLVGMGGDQLVPSLLGRPCPAASAARAKRYAELIDDARAFVGAADLLGAVHERGLAVAIASSAPGDELALMLERVGNKGAIDASTTADDVESSKPAPDVFVAAMEAAGIEPSQAVAVGDSVWDIRAARAAGIGCLAVETGGFSQHELNEEGALHVYRDVNELLNQLATSPIALLGR
ncbi:MAG: putative hydrolase [Acidimicrobiaceae bacterium]|nr:putative hydrolase [Acidimicrobiaceae bacterium]